MSSKTISGLAKINLDFMPGTDIEITINEVAQRVASLRNLSGDIEKPFIFHYEKKELVSICRCIRQ